MNCRYCGDTLPDSARFCIACGKVVAVTGQTERFGDDTLYVTREEYIALLSSAFAVRSPFWAYDDFILFKGRIICIREE